VENLETSTELSIRVEFYSEPADPSVGVKASLTVENVYLDTPKGEIDITDAVSDSDKDRFCAELTEQCESDAADRGQWEFEQRKYSEFE